jgi:hypothetical protein
VKKPLLHLFTAFLLAVTTLPGISRAAPDGDDYVAVQVPDVSQAVTFFRDVMNCRVINDGSRALATPAALMSCGRETTVDITLASGHAQPGAVAQSQSFTLETDDASSVSQWLRANRIHLIGSPTRLTSGQDAGKLAVTFLTPWGQPLQLVSRMKADDLLQGETPASRVAVQ